VGFTVGVQVYLHTTQVLQRPYLVTVKSRVSENEKFGENGLDFDWSTPNRKEVRPVEVQKYWVVDSPVDDERNWCIPLEKLHFRLNNTIVF